MARKKYPIIYNPEHPYEIEIIFLNNKTMNSFILDSRIMYSRKEQSYKDLSYILSPILSIQKMNEYENYFWFRYIYYNNMYSGISLAYNDILEMEYIPDFGYYHNAMRLGFRCNEFDDYDYLKYSPKKTKRLYKLLVDYIKENS